MPLCWAHAAWLPFSTALRRERVRNSVPPALLLTPPLLRDDFVYLLDLLAQADGSKTSKDACPGMAGDIIMVRSMEASLFSERAALRAAG